MAKKPNGELLKQYIDGHDELLSICREIMGVNNNEPTHTLYRDQVKKIRTALKKMNVFSDDEIIITNQKELRVIRNEIADGIDCTLTDMLDLFFDNLHN